MRKLIRTFCFLAALVLLCTPCVSALAAQYNAGGIFTIEYNEADWAIDNFTYSGDTTEDYTWLFLLYKESADASIDVAMERVPEFEGLSLFSAGAVQRADYLASTLDAFQDLDMKYLTTITVSEWEIPFYVYTMEDEQGQFLYAETIVNGCSINFHVCHSRSEERSDALLPALEEILTTFSPLAE